MSALHLFSCERRIRDSLLAQPWEKLDTAAKTTSHAGCCTHTEAGIDSGSPPIRPIICVGPETYHVLLILGGTWTATVSVAEAKHAGCESLQKD